MMSLMRIESHLLVIGQSRSHESVLGVSPYANTGTDIK